MPEPLTSVLSRRAEIVAEMRAIVPGEGVVDAVNEMRVFESDALTAYRQLPLVVVLPETVEQVSAVLRFCNDNGVRVVPRGSGTSLSGGSLPLADAVLLVMSRFNRVLEIDYANRAVVAQPGVTRRRTHKRNSQGPSRWSGSPQIAAAARPGRASNSHHPKMTNHTAIADVPGDCFSRAASACLCFSASPRSQSRNAMSAGSSWRIGRYSKNQFSRLLAMIGNGATNRPAASASLTYGS